MKKLKLLGLLGAILKNSRISVREIAKRIRLSQPTIARTRMQLVKEGYRKTYAVILDFETWRRNIGVYV